MLGLIVCALVAGCGDNGNGETCGSASTMCGTTCVDMSTDNANCGVCGNACEAGTVCNGAGTCAATCQVGLTVCSGTCANTSSDNANCGACGNVCGAGTSCSGGTCAPTCPAGELACNGACIDPNTDNLHCGATADCQGANSGVMCGGGEVCNGAGVCAVSCGSGEIDCNGTCIDPNTSNAYCGATADCEGANAGSACAAGFVCDGSGACALSCQDSLVACGGTCIDPSSNNNYCGASGDCTGANAGSACGSGYVCSGSACVISCPAGELACNGECIDPNTDRDFCGATADCQGANAGSACGSGFVCDGSGACALSCQSGLSDCSGTCTDTDFDPNNCGACGSACATGDACSGGVCGQLLTTFSGPRTDIPIDTLFGWSQCFIQTYDTVGTAVSDVLTACSGTQLMMACRPTGSDTLQLAAYASRDDVTFETDTTNTPHNANGTGWYFDANYSWGFAPEGASIDRDECDEYDFLFGVDGTTPLRLCWHTLGMDYGSGNGTLSGGWRCGSNNDLNADPSFERLIYQANF